MEKKQPKHSRLMAIAVLVVITDLMKMFNRMDIEPALEPAKTMNKKNHVQEISPGDSYLFEEERPGQAYSIFQSMASEVPGVCLTKLHPEKVRSRYGLERTPIIWLTFSRDNLENTMPLDKYYRIINTVTRFVERNEQSIILLDCLDQIIVVNGFERAIDFLRTVRFISARNNSTLIISVNPRAIGKGRLDIIENEIGHAT